LPYVCVGCDGGTGSKSGDGSRHGQGLPGRPASSDRSSPCPSIRGLGAPCPTKRKSAPSASTFRMRQSPICAGA
jgi:hypothetical protein